MENNKIIQYDDDSQLISENIFEKNEINIFTLLVDKLNDILEETKFKIFINNNLIRHIIIMGNIPTYWDNIIIMYLNKPYNLRFDNCINIIADSLIKNNIKILIQDKFSIKFIISILEKDYTILIKERNEMYNYEYFFDINNLEYDIQKRQIVNKINNTYYNFDNLLIIEWGKLNFLGSLGVKNDKNEIIINQFKNNPMSIFELLELFMLFKNNFNDVDIINFMTKLNDLFYKKSDLCKILRKIVEDDNELFLYKKILNYSYSLEEQNLFVEYSKFLIEKYYNFVIIITNTDIDEKLFNLFDIKYLRDFICLLIFQFLIYKKRKIYKIRKKHNSERIDLLESFIDESDEKINEFNMLDKRKLQSLEILKESSKDFVKFDGLIKLIPFTLEDQIDIKNFYNINIILFTNLKDTQKHHDLKLAYIIKRFHFIKKDLLVKIVNIFNYVITYKKYNNLFLIKQHFINMILCVKLNDYIFKKMTEIPKINNNFKNNIDCINILDFQDAFVLFIEFIYRNKPQYSDDEDNINEWFDTIFNSSLCDMRSYRIFENDKRKKAEKKLKKEKKENKEQKKLKIVKKTILNNLEEQSINNYEYIEINNDELENKNFSKNKSDENLSNETSNIEKTTDDTIENYLL